MNKKLRATPTEKITLSPGLAKSGKSDSMIKRKFRRVFPCHTILQDTRTCGLVKNYKLNKAPGGEKKIRGASNGMLIKIAKGY